MNIKRFRDAQTHWSDQTAGVVLRTDEEYETSDDFINALQNWMECNPCNLDQLTDTLDYLSIIVQIQDIKSLSDLIMNLTSTIGDQEQEISEGHVNILTMHQAKGLTADAVIVPVAEDEVIPRGAEGRALGDERRLLYVSLTRARHNLFITYCNQRTGQQLHYGARPGVRHRTLTQFLVRCPTLPIQNGTDAIEQLTHHEEN